MRRNKMPVPTALIKLPSPLISPEGERVEYLARTGTDFHLASPTHVPSEELRCIRCT